MRQLDRYTLKNGMVLLGEPMEDVQSVSFHFMIPAGAAHLPDGCCGAGEVISDWIFRGAGSRNGRQLSEALDGLGIHHSANVSSENLSLSASLEAGHLSEALALFGDIILRPTLDPQQFELSRELAIHELQGLDDDPRSKVMLHLKEQFYPDPYGRPPLGRLSDLQSLTAEQTAAIVQQTFAPSDMIFSICGKYDFDAVCRHMEQLFEQDIPYRAGDITLGSGGQPYVHYPTQGAQVHIGLMTPAPPAGAGPYYEFMAAVSVLSGSMSSRLFTEVREKRGLCYAVGARYRSMKSFAGITCYAGTTPDKAQETLDVIVDQFNLLKNGISDDELLRAKVGLKTSLIMQCESTAGRSAGIAGDYFLLGRVRSMDEIRDKIAALTAPAIIKTLQEHPFRQFTVASIGPQELNIEKL